MGVCGESSPVLKGPFKPQSQFLRLGTPLIMLELNSSLMVSFTHIIAASDHLTSMQFSTGIFSTAILPPTAIFYISSFLPQFSIHQCFLSAINFSTFHLLYFRLLIPSAFFISTFFLIRKTYRKFCTGRIRTMFYLTIYQVCTTCYTLYCCMMYLYVFLVQCLVVWLFLCLRAPK